MNKKNVFLWTLYDFANSIVSVVFFLYFSQWLVVQKGVSDFWYNMIFTAGSVLLLLTAPVLGGIADKNGKQQKYFNIITVLYFLLVSFVSIITLFYTNQVLLAGLIYLLANYLYQFSFVFYNAFLHHIAPPQKWGRISGLGQAANMSGQIVGLLITMPLATGTIYLFGEAGRAQTFLPATIIFFLLALPVLLFFKLPPTAQANPEPIVSLKQEYKSQWGQFISLVKVPYMGWFLLAYFLFNDAIITAQSNFAIYMENVFAVSDKFKSLLLVGILLTSAVGAASTGWVADKIGLKKTLVIILGSWVVIFPVLAATTHIGFFVAVTILMGFFFGATWTVTRAVMTALCPVQKLNFGFSFYTLAERVSTLVGPFAWGAITSGFVHLGPLRYRFALAFMAVFIAIGLIFLKKVEIKTA